MLQRKQKNLNTLFKNVSHWLLHQHQCKLQQFLAYISAQSDDYNANNIPNHSRVQKVETVRNQVKVTKTQQQ